jgi:outer membrane lipase/esterase
MEIERPFEYWFLESSFGEVHMKKFRVLATAFAAAAFLAACGGNEAGNQTPRVAFAQMVNFGDSLSDVGTYDVGFVAASGGGHYSINGVGATGLLYVNWTEFLAAQLQLPQPCAAETGLDTIPGVIPGAAPVTPVFHNTGTAPCYSYAQGGSRVTNPVGPGNKLLFDATNQSTYSNAIGQLTIPVVTQIAEHLTANGGAFKSTDLVTVLAGGNDLFIDLATFEATTAGGGDPTLAATAAVTAMATAGAQLAVQVNTQILAKGATHVVVVNLPDVSLTPLGIGLGAQGQGLILQMAQAFNGALASGLTASDSLLVVDAFTASQDQAANAAQYGLTNVTSPACDLVKASGTSLLCSKATLISALTPTDLTQPATAANGYEYADTVHPTPYGYRLLAELVGEKLAIKGWL